MHPSPLPGPVRPPPRLLPRLAVMGLLVAAPSCQQSGGHGTGLGPDDGERPEEAPLFERVLIGSAGAALAPETWVWNPRSDGWTPRPVLLPAPGVGRGTLARAIRRAAAPPPGSTAGGAVRRAPPPNVNGDAALFAGGPGLDGAPAGRQAYYYDGGSGVATALEMGAPRVEHTLTALFEGRFLVVGGHDASGTPTASAEVFDAGTMAMVPTGSMSHARTGHAASLLPDGRVLVSGGHDDSGLPVRHAEVWDPVGGGFTRAGTLADARIGHTQITLADGRVLVVGGAAENSAEIWDPDTENFTSILRLISRHGVGHTATRLLDDRVLILGGDGTDGRRRATDMAEVFDPAVGAFLAAGPMNSARMGHFAVLLDDGTVLIGGGIDESGFPTASTETYDPVDGRFTTLDDLPAEGTAPAAVFIADSN